MASSNAALLGLVGVGGLLALLAATSNKAPGGEAKTEQPAPSGGQTPKAPSSPASPSAVVQNPGLPPMGVIDQITAALATTDPAAMRAAATALESQGWVVQAGDLRRAADVAALTRAMGQTPALAGDVDLSQVKVRIPRTPQPIRVYDVPDDPLEASPLPGVIAPGVSPASATAARIQAQRLVNELDRSPPKPGEASEKVRAFQGDNGLKASGYYGPSTALMLARKYGLCPPHPVNWPTKGRKRAKANYRDALLAIAAKDPQRAEEFTRAAKV